MALPLQSGGGVIAWLLENPEVGWVVVILYLMWEIRGPRGKIAELTHMIKSITTVVRGLARVHDNIDTQQVDEYLVENGMEPSDFIEGDNPSDIEEARVDHIMDDDGEGSKSSDDD